jgi:uncharacterized protein with HEPN domain
MKKNDDMFLSHILQAIDKVIEKTAELSYKDFLLDEVLIEYVARKIEIIGEASNNLSEEFKIKHNHIPWAKIISMRNVLIHKYFDINLDVLWGATQKSLPELKKWLQPLAKNIK